MHLVIFGAGGHGKVVLDAARRSGTFTSFTFVDPFTSLDELAGCSIVRDLTELKASSRFVVAIGDNRLRRENFANAIAHGFMPAKVIHPSAIIAADVQIKDGAMVLAGAVINPSARIGANTIINTGAIVEHDCSIGDHTHIAPGTTLGGGVAVGDAALIGIGSTVIPGTNIGDGATVAAGAVVTEHVESFSTVYGVPAKAKAIR